MAVCPPNIQATISKRKRPMAPQLMAPIIVKIKAILSSIVQTSFNAIVYTIKIIYSLIKTVALIGDKINLFPFGCCPIYTLLKPSGMIISSF